MNNADEQGEGGGTRTPPSGRFVLRISTSESDAGGPSLAARESRPPSKVRLSIPAAGSQLIESDLAALMLNVSPRRVRQMTADGTLTNHGTRYKMLYRYADIAAIVETRKPKT